MRAGILFVVGVPIGNIDDITIRALNILKAVDIVACEDTRRTGRLLKNLGIEKRLTSYHSYNKLKKKDRIIELLEQGEQVALVTDGGMPVLSDPGGVLIRNVRMAGFEVQVIPGVTALATALTASGFSSNGVYFTGFLSPKKGKRRKSLEKAAVSADTLIVYESPRRIKKLLADVLFVLGEVDLVICREMTKTFEEYISTDSVSVQTLDFVEKGEFTLVISLK